MILKPYKKYFGLCQCKGCFKWYVTIVATRDSNKFFPAYLCEFHALDAIKDPFIVVNGRL